MHILFGRLASRQFMGPIIAPQKKDRSVFPTRHGKAESWKAYASSGHRFHPAATWNVWIVSVYNPSSAAFFLDKECNPIDNVWKSHEISYTSRIGGDSSSWMQS